MNGLFRLWARHTCRHTWFLPVYGMMGPAPFKMCSRCGRTAAFDETADGAIGEKLPTSPQPTTVVEMSR